MLITCWKDNILNTLDSIKINFTYFFWGFPGVSVIKKKKKKTCLPMQKMQETQVQSLDWEDPLEEEMTTHSSILARKIPRPEEPGGL